MKCAHFIHELVYAFVVVLCVYSLWNSRFSQSWNWIVWQSFWIWLANSASCFWHPLFSCRWSYI